MVFCNHWRSLRIGACETPSELAGIGGGGARIAEQLAHACFIIMSVCLLWGLFSWRRSVRMWGRGQRGAGIAGSGVAASQNNLRRSSPLFVSDFLSCSSAGWLIQRMKGNPGTRCLLSCVRDKKCECHALSFLFFFFFVLPSLLFLSSWWILLLCQCVFVTGSVSAMPGFAQRLHREIVAMRPTDDVVKVYHARWGEWSIQKEKERERQQTEEALHGHDIVLLCERESWQGARKKLSSVATRCLFSQLLLVIALCFVLFFSSLLLLCIALTVWWKSFSSFQSALLVSSHLCFPDHHLVCRLSFLILPIILSFFMLFLLFFVLFCLFCSLPFSSLCCSIFFLPFLFLSLILVILIWMAGVALVCSLFSPNFLLVASHDRIMTKAVPGGWKDSSKAEEMAEEEERKKWGSSLPITWHQWASGNKWVPSPSLLLTLAFSSLVCQVMLVKDKAVKKRPQHGEIATQWWNRGWRRWITRKENDWEQERNRERERERERERKSEKERKREREKERERERNRERGENGQSCEMSFLIWEKLFFALNCIVGFLNEQWSTRVRKKRHHEATKRWARSRGKRENHSQNHHKEARHRQQDCWRRNLKRNHQSINSLHYAILWLAKYRLAHGCSFI